MRRRNTAAAVVGLALVLSTTVWAVAAQVAVSSSPRQGIARLTGPLRTLEPRGARCAFWVSPSGDDANPGTRSQPWATIQYAAKTVPDHRCTVWFDDGVYVGNSQIERRFDTKTVFRAVHSYMATFEGDGYVLEVTGSSHIVFRGLEFRHSGPGATGIVVYVAGTDTDHIGFRNDIFHDSFDNDLLKILAGAGSVFVRNSVFYNQGDGEQQMDVNSVTNIHIEGNIFFNDFESSGRVPDASKHYIVVKDSGESNDGVVGSKRVAIERNVFLNWEGGVEAFVEIGNDGKPYFEAQDVLVENNLMIGNSQNQIWTAFGVSGAKDVSFLSNTVVGDLPSGAYAFHADIKGSNPKNQNIRFSNNIWCDPTGTMSVFSGGDPANTIGLTLNNNLYWNGGHPIPGGDVVSPLRDDAKRVVRDPGLEADQSDIVLPVWNGSSFSSGNRTIRAEFIRLVLAYGSIPASSPAVGRARQSLAPAVDILGRTRDSRPDLGSFEAK